MKTEMTKLEEMAVRYCSCNLYQSSEQKTTRPRFHRGDCISEIMLFFSRAAAKEVLDLIEDDPTSHDPSPSAYREIEHRFGPFKEKK